MFSLSAFLHFIRFRLHFMPTNKPKGLAAHNQSFHQSLHDWYRASYRPLPWRTNPGLYRTVVSELMCQQTQIATVLPYFERWIKQLPDFSALAKAPEEKVLKLWEGLGYYSRARNLHRLAKEFVQLPETPTSAHEWQKLPGIGPYTAAAITSISFSAPEACVDGNVIRILARLTADNTAFKNSAAAIKKYTPLAEDLLYKPDPGMHNQAMMELGATVCTKGNPLCTICPVFTLCEGARRGNASAIPHLERPKTEKVFLDRVWITQNGNILFHRIPEEAKRMAGQHELPTPEQTGIHSDQLKKIKPLIRKRSITRYQITESIYLLPDNTFSEQKGDLAKDCVWVPLSKIEEITLSGPHRRWVTKLLQKES
jgi:A/G-specific adenine glycosylase